MEKNPKIVCEIGCNHLGNFDIAMDMIKTAAEYCKVDIIKFQKRNNKELLSPDEYLKPHPVPENSYGETYGDHREFLEFNIEQHSLLNKECQKLGVIYSTSVWDLSSAKAIISIAPELIKIPSAINTNFRVLDYLCKNYKGKIHISLGMTTKMEEEKILEIFEENLRLDDLVLYHCISSYPVDNDELYLLEIKKLVDTYKKKIHGIGFSGHHKGIAPDIAALAIGAEFFERHFTLDRTWKGTDHSASLEPDGLRKLCRDLKSVSKSLRYKPLEILEIEDIQRKKLKKFEDKGN